MLLESGLEYSRIEWRCVESTAKCDVTHTHIHSSRVGRSVKDYVSILDVVALNFIGMAGG